jgi:hypothetical protein
MPSGRGRQFAGAHFESTSEQQLVVPLEFFGAKYVCRHTRIAKEGE